MELILGLGADPNQRLTEGVDWTPLAIAVLFHSVSAARTLVEHGADPNARWCVSADIDESRRTRSPGCNLTNGTTPLMLAASLGDRGMESFLVARGADPSLRDWQGRTAAEYGAKGPDR